MFVLLTRLLLLLLIGFILFKLWKLLGVKKSSIVLQLIYILTFALLILSLMAPDSAVGIVILGLLSVFVKPLGLSILLLIIASTTIRKRKKDDKEEIVMTPPGPTLILITLLILIVSSTPFVADWLAQQLEKASIKTVQTDLCCGERAGAIVLIGKGTTEPKLPYRTQIQLTKTGDRIPYTAHLYRENLSEFIIVSAGFRQDLLQPLLEADDIKTLLVYMGVNAENIIIDPHGGTLRDSAVEVKKLMDKLNLGRTVILVTSALEMRRASLTFARVGLKVIPAPTNFYTFISQEKLSRRVTGADFAPSAEALLLTTKVLEEYFATFYYFTRGWLSPSI
jgi:uncharacterized SAM-binding protein YcdF (DUF218 family)